MNSLYDFLEANSMYVVMLIVLIIWFGIFGYMWRLDNRIKKLEKENSR